MTARTPVYNAAAFTGSTVDQRTRNAANGLQQLVSFINVTPIQAASFAGGLGAGIATRDDAFAEGFAIGQDAGRNLGIGIGTTLKAPVVVTSPTITIVSPTPNTDPGVGGGFPADFATASITPVVLRVTEISPGVVFVEVDVQFEDANGKITVEAVYRGGSFVGPYITSSFEVSITNGIELHVLRDGGWPGVAGAISTMTWNVDAIDADGNVV